MFVNTMDMIIKKADMAIRKAGSRDPEQIAKALNLFILEKDLGHLKGFYTIIKRNRFVVLHERLDPVMRKIVLLHEIGHDQLHREIARSEKGIDLYEAATGHMENEANLFAAHISLPDEEILELIRLGHTADEIAAVMKSNVNLISFKAGYLVRQGYDLQIPEFNRRFLE